MKSPSRYRLRFTGHIYAPAFQDDQLNGNDREISRQKQTFSHVSRSAGLNHGRTDRSSAENDERRRAFGERGEIERTAVACIAPDDSASREHRDRLGKGMRARSSVSAGVSVAVRRSRRFGGRDRILILFLLLRCFFSFLPPLSLSSFFFSWRRSHVREHSAFSEFPEAKSRSKVKIHSERQRKHTRCHSGSRERILSQHAALISVNCVHGAQAANCRCDECDLKEACVFRPADRPCARFLKCN